MGAHIRYDFKKGFLLDEEKLRKIHEIISKRMVGEVKYYIIREDRFSFETINIEDVINQENLKGSKINRIRIKTNKNLVLVLGFDESGGSLDLDGENRDDVFLLNSDLKEYISNEVCNQKIVGKYLDSNIFGFGLIILVGGFIYLMSISPPSGQSLSEDIIKKALESNDINEKINILIQEHASKKVNIGRNEFLIVGILGFIFLGFSKTLSRYISWFFPANLFLFGKESERYEQYLETRKNVFWVIVGGLFVSIIGGLIVWALTLKGA